MELSSMNKREVHEFNANAHRAAKGKWSYLPRYIHSLIHWILFIQLKYSIIQFGEHILSSTGYQRKCPFPYYEFDFLDGASLFRRTKWIYFCDDLIEKMHP